MDYSKIYNSIINNGKNRHSDENIYYESHHIIPKCLGGNDKKDNLVFLTAREHFIAHLLLVKMYPTNYGLVKAANMMCSYNQTMSERISNRRYEWLRIKLSVAMSGMTGEKNSSFGSIWIHNELIKQSKKIDKTLAEQYINEGWKKGRIVNWDPKISSCKLCSNKFLLKTKELFCSEECKENSRNPMFGREEEFRNLYAKHKSMNKALKEMGFKGAMGSWYVAAKELVR